jgi:hypothetical protein
VESVAFNTRNSPHRPHAAPPASTDNVTLRTPEQIEAHRHKRKRSLDIPPGMPTGPWASDEAAKAAIEKWCLNPKTGNGGFGISWCNRRAANTTRGVQHTLACHLNGKQGCKWQVKLEQSAVGWVMYTASFQHNHALTQSATESLAYTGMRSIPDDFIDLAQTLAKAGLPASEIDKVLKVKASQNGEDVTWVQKDIHYAVAPSTEERAFDSTGLLQKLIEREKLRGLPFAYSTKPDGSLSTVFFVCEGGLELYAVGVRVNKTILHYDTTVCAGPSWCLQQTACVALRCPGLALAGAV